MDGGNTDVVEEISESAAREADSLGKRKRKGNPVKVSREKLENVDEVPRPPTPPRRSGLRLERHYSTLKKSYEELKQRYDSLRAMVAKKSGNSRDSKTVARERIRMVAESDEGEEDDEGGDSVKEDEEDNYREKAGELGGVDDEKVIAKVERTISTDSPHRERKVTTKEDDDEEEVDEPYVERLRTRSEMTRRRGRPPKNAAVVSSATTVRSKRGAVKVSSVVGASVGGGGERRSRGRRRSSLQPKERRRLWRQSRPLNQCEYCDYTTRDGTCFKNHVSGHDPEARRFVCEICSKSFRCKRGIQNHRLSHDSPERLHRCQFCSFQTPHKLNWVQHLAVIHKVDPEGKAVVESISCAQCEFTCVANHQLKAHVLRKHTVDKPFKCEQCDYSTVIRHELETHVGIRHKNERRYMCDNCGFRSQTQGGLTRHKRTHTGAKPFKCHLCGICYADSGKLKTHLLRHTSDEKPYVCHVCGHSSRRRDNLRMHLKRIHNCNLEAIRDHRRFQQQLDQHLDQPPPVGLALPPNADEGEGDAEERVSETDEFAIRPDLLLERATEVSRRYARLDGLTSMQHRQDDSSPCQQHPTSELTLSRSTSVLIPKLSLDPE